MINPPETFAMVRKKAQELADVMMAPALFTEDQILFVDLWVKMEDGNLHKFTILGRRDYEALETPTPNAPRTPSE